MNWRERLADWISGGAVMRYHDAWLTAEGMLTESQDYADKLLAEVLEYECTLDRIAAMETPGANATVKRMARMAREALE